MGDRVAALDLEDAAADDAVQLAQLLDVALDQRRGHRRRVRRRARSPASAASSGRSAGASPPSAACRPRAAPVAERRRASAGTAAGLKAPSSGTARPSAGACSRRRLQVPVMKAQASAGRATCGVVRTATPVPRPRSRPWVTSVLADASGSSSRLRFGQGPATMSSCSGFSADRDRVARQLADHDDAEPAVGEQGAGDRVARRGVGVGLGRVEAQQLVVGGRQLDELERRQRRAVALAADDELLHRPAAGRGDAGQELARRRGRDVVDGDEVRAAGARTAAAAPRPARTRRTARARCRRSAGRSLPSRWRGSRSRPRAAGWPARSGRGWRPRRRAIRAGASAAGPASANASARADPPVVDAAPGASGCASPATRRSPPARRARRASPAIRREAWLACRASKRPAQTCRCCSNHSSRPVPLRLPEGAGAHLQRRSPQRRPSPAVAPQCNPRVGAAPVVRGGSDGPGSPRNTRFGRARMRAQARRPRRRPERPSHRDGSSAYTHGLFPCRFGP